MGHPVPIGLERPGRGSPLDPGACPATGSSLRVLPGRSAFVMRPARFVPDDETCFTTAGYPDFPGAMGGIDKENVTER